MPNSITTANITEFKSNVAMLLQQSDSRLAGCVTPYYLTGEAAEILEQFGATTAVTDLPRHADTPILDVPQDRRWCRPTDVNWGTAVDPKDLLRLMIDPKSQMIASGVAALQRKKDDIIAAGMLGTNFTGKSGTTATSFLAGNIVANTVGGGGSAVGLNMAKFREARRILRKGEVNFEGGTIFAALCADKEAELFGEATVINSDFNAGNAPIIANGRLAGILGIQFIHSERFLGGDQSQFTGSGFEIPVWDKAGVALGIWDEVKVKAAEAPTKNFNWIVSMSMNVGATRLEEKRVVKILA